MVASLNVIANRCINENTHSFFFIINYWIYSIVILSAKVETLMLSNLYLTHFDILIENSCSHTRWVLRSVSVFLCFHEYYKASFDIIMAPEL